MNKVPYHVVFYLIFSYFISCAFLFSFLFSIFQNFSLEFDEISLKYYQARIHYNGKVEWSPGRDYSVMCNMDTTLFPFDIQTCKFQFENWMYPGK